MQRLPLPLNFCPNGILRGIYSKCSMTTRHPPRGSSEGSFAPKALDPEENRLIVQDSP